MSSPLVVGIAGGTASGKTTVARKIREALADCRVAFIDQDSYYRDLQDMPLEERREVNFDHPDAFDTDLLVAPPAGAQGGPGHRQARLRLRHLDPRKRDRPRGARGHHPHRGHPRAAHEADPRRDGREASSWTPTTTCASSAGSPATSRSAAATSTTWSSQYFRHVRPMHMGFVEPSKHYADIIVPHGGNNDIAIEMLVGALRARLLRPQLPKRWPPLSALRRKSRIGPCSRFACASRPAVIARPLELVVVRPHPRGAQQVVRVPHPRRRRQRVVRSRDQQHRARTFAGSRSRRARVRRAQQRPRVRIELSAKASASPPAPSRRRRCPGRACRDSRPVPQLQVLQAAASQRRLGPWPGT